MDKDGRIVKIKKEIKDCEREVKNLKKIKSEVLNADIIKTLRSMAYIKIKDILQKEE